MKNPPPDNLILLVFFNVSLSVLISFFFGIINYLQKNVCTNYCIQSTRNKVNNKMLSSDLLRFFCIKIRFCQKSNTYEFVLWKYFIHYPFGFKLSFTQIKKSLKFKDFYYSGRCGRDSNPRPSA